MAPLNSPPALEAPRLTKAPGGGLSVTLLAGSALLFATTLIAGPARKVGFSWVLPWGFGLSAVLAVGGLVAAIVACFRSGGGALRRVKLAALILCNLLMAALGGFAAWASLLRFTRGRQLRRFGRPLLPRVLEGADWA